MATKTVMRASPEQRSRTKAEEGLRLDAYRDTVGILTIGYGRAATNPRPVRGMLDGNFYSGKVVEGLSITLQEAERLFDEDLDEAERGISAMLPEHFSLSQGQFDALCDFVHQYGLWRLESSTLIEKIRFNPASSDVLKEFMRWTMAGGEHTEYVWRRSARRCCVYNGTPIPQKLWRKAGVKDGYPFALKYEDGWKIDYSVTPTVDQLIADGIRLSKKPELDYAKPFPTPEPELVLDKPAPATTFKDLAAATNAAVQAEAPEVGAQPVPPVSSAPVKEPAKVSDDAPVVPKEAPKVDVSPAPAVKPVPAPPVSTKPPEPPPPPPPLPREAAPTSIEPKDMVLSKRFWGLFITGAGTLEFLPNNLSKWINNEGNRELLAWIAVVVVGYILYKYGQKKATKPLK